MHIFFLLLFTYQSEIIMYIINSIPIKLQDKVFKLQASRETVLIYLGVPLFNPCIWTHGFVDFAEIFTRCVALALHAPTPMEVNVTLVAVPVTIN